MHTRIDRNADENTLVIITTCHHDYCDDDGYRDLARVYHQSRAAQALEDVVSNSARYLSTEYVCKMYNDAATAAKNSIVLLTVFRVRYPEDTPCHLTPLSSTS